MNRSIVTCALFLLLLGASLVARALVPADLPAGSDLAGSPCSDAAGWQQLPRAGSIACADETLQLTSEDPSTSTEVRLSLPDPAPGARYLVSATARSADVVTGPRPWNRARVVLAQYAENRRWLPGPHVLFSLDGSHPWRGYREVFEILPGTDGPSWWCSSPAPPAGSRFATCACTGRLPTRSIPGYAPWPGSSGAGFSPGC